MLFDKDREPSCSYCKFGTELSEEEIICLKKGVLTLPNACRRFSYDPLKRIPPQRAPISSEGLSKEDFQL